VDGHSGAMSTLGGCYPTGSSHISRCYERSGPDGDGRVAAGGCIKRQIHSTATAECAERCLAAWEWVRGMFSSSVVLVNDHLVSMFTLFTQPPALHSGTFFLVDLSTSQMAIEKIIDYDPARPHRFRVEVLPSIEERLRVAMIDPRIDEHLALPVGRFHVP
jgi:hypothetical protein